MKKLIPGASLKDSALIFSFLLVIFALIQIWSYGQLTSGLDFYEKWDMAQALRRSEPETVYSPRTLGIHISTPFLYTLVYAFSSGDYATDIRAYRATCLASAIFGIICLCRLLRYPLVAGLVAVAVFLDWFQPLLSDVRVANVNQIQLGLLALSVWMLSKQGSRPFTLLGGLVVGFAVMAKPNLLFVLAMLGVSWLINRRFKKFVYAYAGALIAAAVALVASGIAFGSMRCWSDWLSIVPKVSDYRYPMEQANYSPAMLIFDWVGFRSSALLGGLALAAAAAFTWAGRRKGQGSPGSDREREISEDTLMVGLGCLAYLLSATLVWLHYFVLTIPMALYALRPLDRHSPLGVASRRILGGAALFLLAELPLRSLLSITDPHHSAMLLLSGTLILFGLGMWELLCLGKGK